ncbi:phage portal protein [Cohnella nanjingensis]|uniref:Phage portal protein n=2 Tax=Cohnella nanjingensis TaxID=1387779 RepID=A0A7X0RST1_9BACL|nr:phage portal protein [Cohnella nanjingensis]
MITGRIGGKYNLGSSGLTVDNSRVDYAKARALYDNSEDSYKLSAGFCKPLINAKAGFMGVPAFESEDEDANEVLKDFFGENHSRMNRTHGKALSEGDCFVWLTREETDNVLYPESGARLKYTIIPNEEVISILRDPLTREPVEYVLRSTVEWLDDSGEKRKTVVDQRITRHRRTVELSGDLIPGYESFQEIQNPWGFIPIEHFRNEAAEHRIYGQSDLEPIEPFLRAYHDVMMDSLQGSKLHSTPRLKLTLKDVSSFLANNFGIANPLEFVQKGGTISLEGKEFLIFTEGEDAAFIEAQSAMGSAADALLKLLYYCIVATSETPEFVLGVHTPSAQASVSEQMPVFVRAVSRKRDSFASNWKRLARMVLAMTAAAEMKQFETYATELVWEEIDPRDEKEAADTLKALTEALDTAVRGEMLSKDSAAEFLKAYIPTMKDYDADDQTADTELRRIIQNRIVSERLADGAAGIEFLNRTNEVA